MTPQEEQQTPAARPAAGGQTSASTLKRAYATMERMQRRLDAYERAAAEPIAIVGLGCRFPGGAVDADTYWDVLSKGIDAVTEVPADRWDAEAFFSETPAPGKVSTKSGGFLDHVDRFDHGFFGISRREAVFMDPQQRLSLEVAWEALENAGLAPSSLAGSRTGVFMGVASFDFATETLHTPLDYTAHSTTGFAHSVLPGRISYTLDLRGPSVAVDTACSSSLVAVHQACQSLRAKECDLALTGGVNVILSPLPSVSFSQFGRMVSVDGRCKAFDASANGYVRSEGCGVIVLKRLSEAVRDGDAVLAVIRGGALNQDGRSAGLTAPNGSSQRDVLRAAVAAAGVRPEEVNFVEAHGTGTRIGDPIEVEALADVYGRPEGSPVYLGSCKTNIGHPEAAAGIAALIKVVLSLQHGAVPGNVHFKELNPDISFDGTTFAVPTELTPWPAVEGRRIAGVSSFGFSGTNAHLLLEQAPDRPEAPRDDTRPRSVLALSAKSETALAELAAKYRDHLGADGADSVADVCYSANTGRSAFRHRLAVAGATTEDIAAELAAFTAGGPVGEGTAAGEARSSEAVFLFTGQGVQRTGMARGLYETQPTFRAAIDRCAEILRPMLAKPLLSVLYPDDPDSQEVNETGYAQPAVFAVEYAMAQLWMSWGVQPVAVLGHSFGEYVASCVAGAMSLEDGLKLTVARSRLMQLLADTGAMAAISASELEVAEEIADWPDRISIAAVNGPANTTISGERELVERVCEIFSAREVRAKLLHITTSSHSPLIEPILEPLRRAAQEITFIPPRIPLISNLDGELWQWDQAPDADYWCRHARRPVRFAAGISTLLGLGYRTFIEVGPAPVLLGLVGDMLPADHDALLLPSLRPKQNDWQVLSATVAQFHAGGGDIDWTGFDADYTRTKVRVPTYAFEGTSCWREPRNAAIGAAGGLPAGYGQPDGTDTAPADGSDAFEDEDLLYRLAWQQAPDAPAPQPDGGSRTWLLLADGTGVADAVADAVTGRGDRCVRAVPGTAYHYDGTATATVRRDTAEDLARLLDDLGPDAGDGLEVVHLWSLDAAAADPVDAAGLLRAQDESCMSAVRAAQALARRTGTGPARLWLVSQGAVRTGDDDPAAPAVAPSTLWGLGRSLQQEHSAIWGGLIDLGPQEEPQAVGARLTAEIGRGDGEDQIALRGAHRYVARLVREASPEAPGRGFGWRRDAAYLVTGGLGGVGLAVARSMAQAGARRLILAGRTALPPRGTWSALPADDPAADRVAAVRELESLGVSVRVAALDVSDEEQVGAFLERYDQEGHPPIRGVVHAAGVGDVVPLLDLEPDVLQWHLRAKALGAWVLHREFAGRELDFFTLFSSTSSLLSSPFFAAYAAANAFLDALAELRRGQGLPALSVNWGIWQDTGMAAREAASTPGLSRGMGTLRPGQALRVFHRLFRHDGAQIAVVPVDWEDWGRRYQEVSGSALLSELVGSRGSVPAARAMARRQRRLITRDELFALPEPERVPTLTERLLHSVTAALDAQSVSPAPDQPLLDLGVDSLMAVELKNEIEGGLGVSLPISAFLEGASVSRLVEQIMAHLSDGPGAPAGEAGIRKAPRYEDAAAELLAQLAELPDGQVPARPQDRQQEGTK
ncbi:putative modular polyketide synthase [Streptomyces sp. NBRC 110611]|uniref:type I polyketide synthase n=1 Tax=Streptomyces sp. NBRC 110611 TaxID=1621259 RepID=UPI0008322EA8|nr:type I polyketide synthase [Streptomyces sp. NBRC 110611]GAU68946.1 putative modular polyketide synthase [Streptomyces sp. NBRC 110611]